MDICLQIIDKPATHDLSYDPAKEARRLRRGDIIDVFPADNIGTWDGSVYIPNEPIGSPRCGFVFVVGVPDNAWDRIQKIASVETDETGDILFRRKFRAQVAAIPVLIRNRFLADRYITFTWTQVKNYIRRTRTAALLTDTDIS